MAVFIAHESDGLLLSRDKRWVSEAREAHAFGSSLQAIQFCVRHEMRAVRLLLRSEGQPDLYVQPFGPLRAGAQSLAGAEKRLQDQARAEAVETNAMVAREKVALGERQQKIRAQ